MDIGNAVWNEDDASNNTPAPDGFPEGMPPSGVNNGARSVMGAIKRFWNRLNPTKTTAGGPTTYTLSYTVAPGAYVNGELYSFIVNVTCGVAPTLNVNSLGPIPLRLFGGNLLAGALIAGQIVTARYNTSAGAFDILPQDGGWVRIGMQEPSGVATVDFEDIPAGVTDLQLLFSWTPDASAVDMFLRTYDPAGNLDTGGSDYAHAEGGASSGGSGGFGGGGAVSAMVINRLGNSINNSSSFGISGSITAYDIQALRATMMTWQATYLDSAGTNLISSFGGGWRQAAESITGLQAYFSTANGTGKLTLLAR